MHRRTLYLDRIRPLLGKPVIKVVTGMRRVGKSYLLRQIIDLLATPEVIQRVRRIARHPRQLPETRR